MDIPTIVAGAGALKTGFDTVRSVLGLVKDVQGILPPGEKKDVIGHSLAQAEREIQLAEAQIAKALGYRLCRCVFPPIPMLLAGYRLDFQNIHFYVYECPVCKTNTAELAAWLRTVGANAGQAMPPLKPDY